MIKSYTSLEQSKQLAKFLPIESADMRYAPFGDTHPWFLDGHLLENGAIPCWTLSALLDIIPEGQVNRMTSNGKWMAVSWPPEHYYIAKDYDSAVDACYALILGLHNQNIL